MRRIPRGMRFWPEQPGRLSANEVVNMYQNGFAGAWEDQAAREVFRAEVVSAGGIISGSAAAHASGIADMAAGQLVLPFLFCEQLYPGCLPGAAQERGDCVGHSETKANFLTICCEIVSGVPDEVTGMIEGPFEASPAGITEGVLSTEYNYWFRGYNGDGWDCGTAARMTLKYGVMIRKPYPELGIDLTAYSSSLAGRYGRTAPPANIAAVGQQHLIRTATELESAEEVRDFLANGKGISSCGGEGFSSSRDENGVASRRGGWSHAMSYIGFDDRAETKQIYNGPLVLVQNSWGVWNGGPRRIRGTNIDIPHGSFWARWADIRNRYMIARAGVNGWQRRSLPTLGFEGLH